MNDKNKELSNPVEILDTKIKRVCLTLDLKNNPVLIKEYEKYHSIEGHWMEISQGIKKAGIIVMDIYRVDNRMFMICEVPNDKDFDIVWESMAKYPRQSEWGELMQKFQQAIPGQEFGWIKMKRIYSLNEMGKLK